MAALIFVTGLDKQIASPSLPPIWVFDDLQNFPANATSETAANFPSAQTAPRTRWWRVNFAGPTKYDKRDLVPADSKTPTLNAPP